MFGGQNRGELVIVAKARPCVRVACGRFGADIGKLLRRNHVVFIDDWNDSMLHEFPECSGQVFISIVVIKVRLGEQDLRTTQIVMAKKAFVHTHKTALANGCTGLPCGKV